MRTWTNWRSKTFLMFVEKKGGQKKLFLGFAGWQEEKARIIEPKTVDAVNYVVHKQQHKHSRIIESAHIAWLQRRKEKVVQRAECKEWQRLAQSEHATLHPHMLSGEGPATLQVNFACFLASCFAGCLQRWRVPSHMVGLQIWCL